MKTKMEFNLSCVTLAFAAGATAESAFDTLGAEVVMWHAAQVFPSNTELGEAIRKGLPHLTAGTIKVYASCMLSWAKYGKLPRSLSAMVKTDPPNHVKGKGGRKAKPAANSGAGAEGLTEKKETTVADLLLSARGIRAGLMKITSSMVVADALDAYIACLLMELPKSEKK